MFVAGNYEKTFRSENNQKLLKTLAICERKKYQRKNSLTSKIVESGLRMQIGKR